MKMLVLNNYVDQLKFVPQMDTLRAQVETNCQAEIETVGYQHFDADYARNRLPAFDAVIMSGSEALYSKPEVRSKFLRTIRATREIKLPLLGICGGHQLIGMAYGEQVVAIGKSVKGYRDVEIVVNDPLFEDLSKATSLMQSHQEMVERVPKDFELLARSVDTPIEAFRGPNRVLYGVQFHPERNDSEHPAGAKILENFGRLVKATASK